MIHSDLCDSKEKYKTRICKKTWWMATLSNSMYFIHSYLIQMQLHLKGRCHERFRLRPKVQDQLSKSLLLMPFHYVYGCCHCVCIDTLHPKKTSGLCVVMAKSVEPNPQISNIWQGKPTLWLKPESGDLHTCLLNPY